MLLTFQAYRSMPGKHENHIVAGMRCEKWLAMAANSGSVCTGKSPKRRKVNSRTTKIETHLTIAEVISKTAHHWNIE